jgi:cytochrome c-type biogenesis protein CcmH/NrfG
MAIAVFTFNVRQFPKSANAYDSLGEALMRAGRIDESILNYRKSVELDPGNENAKKLIEKMEKQAKAGKK